jgi:isopenicillin N synthase-like dioxygenase
MSIPVIDFEQYISGNKSAKENVAKSIDEGLQAYGFVQLTNHKIASSKVEECFNWVCTFCRQAIVS